jgi:hypothetical protein
MKEAFDNYAMMVEDQKAVSGDTDLSDDEMIGYLVQVDADVDVLTERLMSGEEIDLEDETLRTSNKVVYAFMDKQIDDYEDVSKKVLKDNNWGCSTFYELLKRKSYYKGYNPFKGIN